jgi:type IV secretory pathway VirB2 component (pilin)
LRYTVFALAMMGNALAQAVPPANGPEALFIKFGCAIVKVLSGPGLVAVTGAVLLLIFGWNKATSDMNATQTLKSGVIGLGIVLGAAAFSTAIFGAACA